MPGDAHPRCGQCGAPVEESQRYCVACGSHRRHVRDPATQFLAGASAARRSQSRASGPPRRRSRSPNLAMALLIATLPVAISIGVLVGRSSTSGDSQLVSALRSQRPQIITTAGAGAGSVSAAPVGAAAAATRARAIRAQAVGPSAAAGGGRVLARSVYGAAHQIAGSHASTADLSSGRRVVQRIQQTQGKSYVNAQRGLPDQISVP